MEKLTELLGEWDVEGVYEYLKDESRWIYIDKYKSGAVVWHFMENGELSAFLDGKSDYKTNFFYNQNLCRLLIDQSHIECLKVHNIRYIDHYRVNIINSREVWLYDLEEVGKEPDDYWLALKINKRRSL